MSTNTAAGKTIHNDKVKNLVITAFFTAITFLGIQSFRIPLPAAVGTPFLHFGHIFVVMGLLLQGGKRGAVSGTLGLTIFDMLNGYMQDAPKTFVETALKCLIVGALFVMLKKKTTGDKKKEYLCRGLRMHQRDHGIYYGNHIYDDHGKWIRSGCGGSIYISSGYGDQCSLYGDRIYYHAVCKTRRQQRRYQAGY